MKVWNMKKRKGEALKMRATERVAASKTLDFH